MPRCGGGASNCWEAGEALLGAEGGQVPCCLLGSGSMCMLSIGCSHDNNPPPAGRCRPALW